MHKILLVTLAIFFAFSTEAQVYVVDNDKVYYYDEVIENADAETFDIISSYKSFAMDKNHIYYLGKKTNFDRPTFKINTGWRNGVSYISDKNDVYLADDDFGYVGMGIAHPLSFSVKEGKLATDETTIYWDFQPIAGSNSKSLRIINDKFFADENHVYLEQFRLPLNPQEIELFGDTNRFGFASVEFVGDSNYICDEYSNCFRMDVNSFEYLNRRYAKDHKKVLIDSKYLNADASTFSVPNSEELRYYAKDATRQFDVGNAFPFELNEGDVESYESLGKAYKDVENRFRNLTFTISCWGNGEGKIELEEMPIDSLEIIYVFPKSDSTLIRKGKSVYMNGEIFPIADANTFKVLNNDFATDKNNAYLIYEYKKSVSFDKIDAADPSTFSIIENAYSKDAKNVYYRTSIVEDANPASFKVISKIHNEDAKSVFLHTRKVELLKPIPNAKLEEIEDYFYKYGNVVFYKYSEEEYLLENINLKEFKVITSNYVTNGQNLLYKGKKIAELAENETVSEGSKSEIKTSLNRIFRDGKLFSKRDLLIPKKFENMNQTRFGNIYTRCGDELLYGDEAVSGVLISDISHSNPHNYYFLLENGKALYRGNLFEVDANSFEELITGYARDANFVYYEGKKNGFDPNTFIVLGYYGGFTMDKNGVYYDRKRIPMADPATFNMFKEYGFDKNNIYHEGKVIPRSEVKLRE